ncbi:MAG: sulfur carrier protein ThiS [Candidatus Cloacimonetes bacterium]|nr:sulfur carrier protein ThiS [Candidatus Cloacimonadota bacterium]
MITVNTESFPWEEGLTITRLIKRKRFTFRMLVVKIDGAVVKKPAWPETKIPDGADVQVIHLMSGG